MLKPKHEPYGDDDQGQRHSVLDEPCFNGFQQPSNLVCLNRYQLLHDSFHYAASEKCCQTTASYFYILD